MSRPTETIRHLQESEKPERPVILWDCDDSAEELTWSDKNKAIEAYLDGNLDEHSGTITVYGYARKYPPKPDMDDASEQVIHWFETNWVEYQGEEEPDISNITVEAALEFLTVLHRNYVPWACEQVTSEEIDVSAWIAEHRPHWLKEAKDGTES